MREFELAGRKEKIRYHDFPGEKTPILFIHGLGCASSFDSPEVAAQPELSGHRRILIDLLGAGFSDKPEDFEYTIQNHAQYLLAFIRELKLDKIILFGHSLGGAVALTLASLYEGEIEHVILSEANLDSGGGFVTKQIASMGQQEFVASGFDALVLENRQSSNEMWAATFSVWLPQAAYQASASAVAGQTPSWRQILYALDCPKAYIFGAKNMDDPDVAILRGHGVQIGTVPEAGHSMAWENPRGLALAVHNALA